MIRKTIYLMVIIAAMGLARCDMSSKEKKVTADLDNVAVCISGPESTTKAGKMEKTDEEWKKILTPMQYDILRRKGTERPFTGEYDKFHGKGKYVCAACGNVLFESGDKFNSGTGWPSFTRAMHEGSVKIEEDRSFGMVRTEVLCAVCGGHLGHVFDDGPAPTGKRFCMNSAALKFVQDK